MIDNEKLIEEAAKAIYDASWQGFEGEVFSDVYARIAFAVFEKALTPTDEEREALAKLIDEIDSAWLTGEDRSPYPSEMAHELSRRGVRFRRTEAPEPTEGEGQGWVCLKCGGSAHEHSLETSTCIWEPV